MRNQVDDAEQQLGLEAATIHSDNTDEWDAIQREVVDGNCDLLLISPERLANERFQREVLSSIADELGLLVIDEAHCISSWGHDFRPDYRRISHVLDRLPEGIPIAATTATANDRVVDDVTAQLPDLTPLRGDLVRESLHIQTIQMESRAERLAWLAEKLEDTPVSGIIYCLTTSETENVAGWLAEHSYEVLPYHGGMEGEVRQEHEAKLMNNEVDALVATNALGMGFNKPDLGWVVHFQRPPNLIRYYQEIGRAGRALDESYAVTLSGPEDDEIAEYFIDQAFPSPDDFETVLTVISDSEEPLYKYQILRQANISWQAVTSCLNMLEVEGAVRKEENGFVRTEANWTYDYERVDAVTEHRHKELKRIQQFVATDECLTRFIDDELDGQLTTACGRCANCAGEFVSPTIENKGLIEEARGYYRSDGWQQILPRKYKHKQAGGRVRIPDNELLEPGRSLSVYKDPGWGWKVHYGKHEEGSFDDELVEAAAEFITEWNPAPKPAWVTAVPSNRYEGLVIGFAERLADELDLEFINAIEHSGDTVPQMEFSNSYQKCWNVVGRFRIADPVPDAPVLLVDDIVGSRWTLTEVGTILRRTGSGPVHPFTLAERRAW
jgi:ATP-dependent DNA helicase RecQ